MEVSTETAIDIEYAAEASPTVCIRSTTEVSQGHESVRCLGAVSTGQRNTLS